MKPQLAAPRPARRVPSPRLRGVALCVASLLGALLAAATPAAAQTPIVVGPPATATPAARLPIAPPRAARDLSAALPVPTLVPTATPLPVTPALRPATLTPTPVPPTPVPSPTPVIALAPTAVAVAVLPREPTPPTEDEHEGSVLEPAAATARSAARETITAPSAALPREPRAPAPTRNYVVGLPEEAGRAGWLDPDLLWLGVPSRSQYDGTPYAAANCGPSALGMILEAYGLRMSTAELRAYANYLQGTYGYDDGIALDHLAEIGRRANLKPIGLYGRSGYRRWSVDDVRASVLAGYPVIVLTKYRLLPGNDYYGGNVNHYVVISGLLGDDFLYNDSAFGGGGERGLVISAGRLEEAWATADVPRHAVAFALGDAGYGLLTEDATRYGRGVGRVPVAEVPSLADQQAVALERLVPGSATAAAAEARRARVAAERRGLPPEPATVVRGALLDTPSRASSLLDTSFAGGPAAIPAAPAAPAALPLPASEALAAPALDQSLGDELTLVAATSSTGDGSAAAMLLPLGGVGSIFLLLVVQGLSARRPARPAGRQSD